MQILKNLKKDIQFITKYYKTLIYQIKRKRSVGSINEWIIDNYYIISEQKNIIEKDLLSKEIMKIEKNRKQEIKNIIENFIKQDNYKLSTSQFFKNINEYQVRNNDYFSYDEIYFINTLIRIIIINQISEIGKKQKEKFILKKELETKFKNINKIKDIKDFIKIDKSILDKPFYIEELNYKLNEFGDYSQEVFERLQKLLEENNLQLKDIIKKEHDTLTLENVYMVNLFDSLKKSSKYKIEFLYYNISFSEKILIKEKAKIYEKMYESSKIEYRLKIKKEVKKNKKTKEIEFIKELVKKADKEKKHIGFILFKEKHMKLRERVYVFSIIMLTILISFFISLKVGFISFFILLIPICGIITDIITQLLMKYSNVIPLFRIKLENKLPKEYSTMVVIPTIIKSKDKIDKMFNNLEIYYLSNRSENLYFSLLADASSEKTKKTEFDEEIAKYGIKKAEYLNKKYNKERFFFVYRNREYNKSEDCYLGYERKRGALNHFNKLLLNKLSTKEKKEYFKCHTFKNFNKKIKYVITLDADTKLLLNTALKLIGTMVHPMNQPVLKNNKVISGYAMMQPRITIDAEVTNKSEYSQLFAGLGGLDIYTTKSFDLYQDVFNEGSFVGKGIYDLEVFDSILSEAFPENLILSHDLIEGNYLRCGFISDVELFDDYPSKYLNDAIRHHRWTRGDWQILSWLKNKVKSLKHRKTKNLSTLIGKWKIFDNLRRSLTMPSLLLLLVYGFVYKECNAEIMVALILVIISIPIIFYLLNQILTRQKYDVFLKYYLNLIRGFIAVVLKSIVVLSLLPYESYLYIDAIIKSLYRMYISKKNLLNWITAEEVEAISKNDVITYLKEFTPNYVGSFILIFLTYYFKNDYLYLSIIISSIWVFAPILMYLLGRQIKQEIKDVNEVKKQEIKEIAERTWKFFSTFLTKENNYLIPDNYQLNRNNKVDYRTSPTNIGFSITSVISAYELNFIKEDETIEILNNIIKSIEKLKKWNGHLYNWYDIGELRELQPFFVSTADSGNFVASLFVLKGFLQKNKLYKVLLYRVNKLIYNTDFSKLYNKDAEVFAVGYNVKEQELTPFHYNNFLSESRIASFVAIAKQDVPFRHWFCLDKTLTKFKFFKGIVSWTGTMFEYYMPYIFMKSYEHTLLDETYSFSFFAQKEFVKEISNKLPWGITESAYNELDDSQNYKYKAFGIPQLKFHDNETPQIVIAPYASIMAMSKYPFEVYKNIKKLKKLNMYDEYGFFESYDNEDKSVVKAYYSHHQGMILSSIANYLKNNTIQEYFHHNKIIQAISVLLKEKVQIRPYIDLKIVKYKKHNYNRTQQVNDIRELMEVRKIPEVGILSNGFYSIFLNDRGIGFSKYKNLQINRYRKITDEKYGMFFYIKNKKNNKFFTNTYYPSIKEPDKYHVVFASDRIKYMREDKHLITTTEITVTKDHNAEIRKLTIENTGKTEKELEITSYLEVILSRIEEDVSHRAFNSITISSEVDEKTKSLIFKRKSRTKEKTEYYLVNRFFEDEEDLNFEYETSRLKFIGRNNDSSNPDVITNNINLTSNFKDLIDPISSIRKNIIIKPNSKKTLYYLVGFGKSKEQVMEVVEAYNNSRKITNAFEESTILNNTRNTYANLNGRQLSLYNTMLKYIYQTVPYDEVRSFILKNNNLSQSGLWRFGISGTLPLITVRISDVEDAGFIKEILQAYEFYKSRAMYIDIAIINDVSIEKRELIEKYIDDLLFRINNLNYFEDSPGNIYKLKELNDEETNVIKTYSKIYIEASQTKTLGDQIFNVENQIYSEVKTTYKNIDVKEDKTKLENINNYGGFINEGKEYYIKNRNTPMPWINVLANKSFGTIVSNNLSGFTYLYNSREFKLTSWSNDSVTDPQSEIFLINSKKVIPSSTTHGLGYTKFKVNTNEYNLNIDVFVSINDNVKVYEIEIEENSKLKSFDLEFLVKPVLGVSEEDTNRHILSNFDKDKNCVIFNNVYNTPYKLEKMFISSNLKIEEYDSSKLVTKSIKMKVNTKTNKKVIVILGDGNDIENIIGKYLNIKSLEKELVNTKEYWKNITNIKIKTPDDSFDYAINYWYLYQVYASRIYSRTGFYQVGGATGFRDQLQDSMSLIYNNSEFTRNQILNHAMHQFKEGDVLHWWHEDLKFGSKTRFSDDYLWLVYVTYEYLKNTNDYSILEEKVCFVDSDVLNEYEEEKGVSYNYTEDKETLYFHLKLCIEKALNQFGEHGLPLMGSGDWNDGMNKIGVKHKGESVWVGFFLYDCLNKMSEILKNTNDDKDFMERCVVEAYKLKDNINKNGFDQKWYLRAFFDNKEKLGSIENDECKIDLICQAWSILTNIVEEKNLNNMLEEVEKRLVDKDNKIIKLLDPAFENPKNNPGYISYYIKGVRENGGQYTHAALWYVLALLKLGKKDRAYEYYSMINPINRTKTNKDVEKYKTEPYVIAADIYSNEANKGRGGWTWYTGSASWAYKIAIENILGLNKKGDILEIKPNLPKWDKVEIEYKHKETIYNIIINTNKKEEIYLDDKLVKEIKLLNDKKVHNIIVNIGG